jgi:hypothetical protein
MIRYGLRFGCRFGQAHDFKTLNENKAVLVEQCKICGKKNRWHKGHNSRIDNQKYLFDHVRQYAQKFGTTKIVFKKLYEPKNCIIHI